jgi:hypothetical protein
MSEPVPVKRRRGGQPGNQNAKQNRGNTKPRPNFGNRGGNGAPKGNQFARKPCRLASVILFEDYQNNAEARGWIEAHRAQLDALNLCDEKRVDRATRDGHLGLTPDRLAEQGAELRFGLARFPDDLLDEAIAA